MGQNGHDDGRDRSVGNDACPVKPGDVRPSVGPIRLGSGITADRGSSGALGPHTGGGSPLDPLVALPERNRSLVPPGLEAPHMLLSV